MSGDGPSGRPLGPESSTRAGDEITALVALTALVGMGPRRLRAVLAEWSAVDAWEALSRGRLQLRGDVSTTFGGRLAEWLRRWGEQAPRVDPSALLETCSRLGVTILALGTPAYPPRLRQDPDPPQLIYALGDLGLLEVEAAAIVGTRAASAYGLDVAFELGAALAEAGVTVVSGLAAGIDGSAHRGALSVRAGMGPIGVVGSGLDVVYPRSHRQLWQLVAERGLLVSEAPPGVAPEPWRFPARNRIIAALSRAVVVVESPEHGGSMITADEALGREIPVLAVPGSVRSPVSTGPHRLIFDGCGPARSPDDVLVALGHPLTPPPPGLPPRLSLTASAAGRHRARRTRRQIDGSSADREAGPVVGRPAPCSSTDPAGATSGSPAADRTARTPPTPRTLATPPTLPPPTTEQRLVLDALGWDPATLDELIERTGLAVARAALLVEELDQLRLVQRELGYVRRRR